MRPIPAINAGMEALLIKHEVEEEGQCAHWAPEWITMWEHKVVVWLIFLEMRLVSHRKGREETGSSIHQA
jgi:hypothetical protein